MHHNSVKTTLFKDLISYFPPGEGPRNPSFTGGWAPQTPQLDRADDPPPLKCDPKSASGLSWGENCLDTTVPP